MEPNKESDLLVEVSEALYVQLRNSPYYAKKAFVIDANDKQIIGMSPFLSKRLNKITFLDLKYKKTMEFSSTEKDVFPIFFQHFQIRQRLVRIKLLPKLIERINSWSNPIFMPARSQREIDENIRIIIDDYQHLVNMYAFSDHWDSIKRVKLP